MKKLKFAALVFAAFVFWACGDANKKTEDVSKSLEETSKVEETTHAKEKPHWGYGEENGPAKWGDMSDDFVECKIGKNQSPIDIITQNSKKIDNNLMVHWTNDSIDIVNNGHTIQVNFESKDGKNGIMWGPSAQEHYDLVQLHFHTPSENYVDSKVYPLEAHFVHKNENGEFLVVGLLIEEGDENKELQKIVNAAPKNAGEKQALSAINPSLLIPQDLGHYAFDGSLTTPPCSEKVQWVVLKSSVTASKDQIEALHTIMSENARGVQPLNDRDIFETE